MNKRIVALLSLMFCGLLIDLPTNIAMSQALPINTILKDGLGGEKSETKQHELPDPLKLSATWWGYFSSKNEDDLKGAIEAFIKHVSEQIAQLPAEEQKQYQTVVNQISANLTAYEAFKRKSVKKTSVAKIVIAQQYSIKQLIDLMHQERDLEGNAQRLRLEVSEYEKQLRALDRQLNTSLARYLEMTSTDSHRFHEGLNIIQLQTDAVLIDERYKAIKIELDGILKQLDDVKMVMGVAVNSLVTSETEIQQLRDAINQSEQRMQELSAKLSREQQFAALMDSSGTKEDAAVARYRELRVLNTQVHLATIQAQIVLYKMEENLLQLLFDGHSDNEKAMKMVRRYDKELSELNAKAISRTEQNEIERIRSTELLAESHADGEQSLFLRNIIQDRSNLIQDTSITLQRLNVLIEDSNYVSRLTKEKVLALSGGWRNTYYKARLFLSDAWKTAKESTSTSLFKVGETPVTASGLVRFVVVLFVSWWIAFWLNKLLLRVGNRNGGDKLPAFYLTGRLTYYSIILVGFLGGLTIIGIDFTNFALVAGALAIGLGFGLQSIVNNFVSGLIILFERSIKVGDFIELQDRNLRGEVRAINVRATIIADNDNVEIVIPNSELINTKMLNWTLTEPHRRIRYPFRVAYGTDKELVREAVLKYAEEVPHTLKGIPGRNPAVWLNRFGDYYYEFELVVWLTARAVKRPNSVHAAYMWAIDTALKVNNIEVPVPQSELRFRDKSAMAIKPFEDDTVEKSFKDDLREVQLSLFKKSD
ncbi:mechanosensitive ion channel [Wohlfahrtiimonas chitiniclastica]|uniref:mechanosensitive ion channel domain-containing protein n=1 Tax=Wohlfahrtiimonas chitiniclastica TaxID=400946 RepID=UPI0007B41DB2|nr:mechanosensitive ion channel domain-containing protein [Wohlfahrtiimonas chitiniclastica]WHR55536.1 mechanosensitive ion channel [Wohlfahrtiimonas chitiniclastica]